MPTPAARAAVPLVRLLGFKRVFADADAMRAHVDAQLLRPPPYGPPRWLRRDVRVTAGRHGTWPAYLVAPRDHAPHRHVVHVHGGAWVNQINPLHWRFVAALAATARVGVTVPIYPLAPLGTAAEVVPAVADAVQQLVDAHGADRVALAGDSAGGQIALSAALVLRDRGVAPLHRTLLIAPALDLTLDNPEIDLVEPRDPWLARPGTRAAIELWRGGLDVRDPLVSPLFGDLRGLGPLTVFSGTRDITDPDTRELVRRARAAGVGVDHHEERDLVHVYPLLPLPEGRRALRVAAAALRG
ncbi:alpha/beta hydrolase fold domain-containing protein [Kineococcus glutinatus]|uniref:Alpha/beta hydrolase fold domain-containing protein n=1 Tax=Kineococcus glutinatus TaxID=1070872 RepID=A0ABP8VC54_9ACTN